jgi:hypothetical protein
VAEVDSGQGIHLPTTALLTNVQGVKVPLETGGGTAFGPDRKEGQGAILGALAHMENGEGGVRMWVHLGSYAKCGLKAMRRA